MNRLLRSYVARDRWLGRQGKDFVVLAVDEFDCDLNAVQRVVAREINRALGVLEVVPVHWVCSPVAEAAQIKLRPDVLQKNFHALQPYWYESTAVAESKFART